MQSTAPQGRGKSQGCSPPPALNHAPRAPRLAPRAPRLAPRGLSGAGATLDPPRVRGQDGGDPKAAAAGGRDVLFEQAVGGAGAEGAAPRELARTEFRFRGVSWGDGALALLRESEYKTRRARTWQLEPASGRRHPAPLLEYSIEDLYRHPGSPMTALAVPPRPRPPPLPARRRRCPDELRRGRRRMGSSC